MAKGMKITFRGGRLQQPRLDDGSLTRIGKHLVENQKERWLKGMNAEGLQAKPLNKHYMFQKQKYTGIHRPKRDMKMTGKTIENFSLRKARDNYIRAENTTRLERAKASKAQGYENMIGFSPAEQTEVLYEAQIEYNGTISKAWIQGPKRTAP
jgi:hypothetical protein